MEALPNTVTDLIDQLDKTIPEKCPDPEMSDREIWLYAGQRKLIRLLKRLREEAEENIMEIR